MLSGEPDEMPTLTEATGIVCKIEGACPKTRLAVPFRQGRVSPQQIAHPMRALRTEKRRAHRRRDFVLRGPGTKKGHTHFGTLVRPPRGDVVDKFPQVKFRNA